MWLLLDGADRRAGEGGLHPTGVRTSADVQLEKLEAGYTITTIALSTQVMVTGIDAAAFQLVAQETKRNCPVSRALGGVTITLEASLAT